MFLEQLPRPYSSRQQLQVDDATAPLAVARSAFGHEASTVTAEDTRRRRDLAVRLLSLLVHLAMTSPPHFHSSSLGTTLVRLLCILPTASAVTLMSSLSPLLPWNVMAHIYALSIEELAGVRSQRMERRKQHLARKRRRLDDGTADDEDGAADEEPQFQMGFGFWAPPTFQYLPELLALHPVAEAKLPSPDSSERMVALKLVLALVMKPHVLGQTVPGENQTTNPRQWKAKIQESMALSDSSPATNEQTKKTARLLLCVAGQLLPARCDDLTSSLCVNNRHQSTTSIRD